MATKAALTDNVIKIVIEGTEQAKAKLDDLGKRFKTFSDASNGIGNKGFGYFAAGTATIAGFLRAADPVRFQEFTVALQVLSLHIGRTFIPILKDVTQWINRVIAYFKGMSDQTRDSILHWTKLALATALAVGAISRVATIAGPLMAGLSTVGTIVVSLGKSMMAVAGWVQAFGGGMMMLEGPIGAVGSALIALTGPIGWIIAGVVAAMGAIVLLGGQGGAVLDTLKDAWLSVWNVIVGLWDILKPFVSFFASALGGVIAVLAKGIAAAFMVVGTMIEVAMNNIAGFLDLIKDVGFLIYEAFKGPLESVGGLFVKLFNFVKALFDQLERMLFVVKYLSSHKLDAIADPSKVMKDANAAFTAKKDAEAKDKADAKKKAEDPSRFSPKARIPAPQLIGIGDAFRRVQTSQINDPQKRYEQELLQATKRGLDYQKQIADNTGAPNVVNVA